jgi:hypothetical protein
MEVTIQQPLQETFHFHYFPPTRQLMDAIEDVVLETKFHFEHRIEMHR